MKPERTKITLTRHAADGYRQTRSFRTIEGARRFAHGWIGMRVELGSSYAVSYDGMCTLSVAGARLRDVFPAHCDCKVCRDERAERGLPELVSRGGSRCLLCEETSGLVIQTRPVIVRGELIDVVEDYVPCPVCNPPQLKPVTVKGSVEGDLNIEIPF